MIAFSFGVRSFYYSSVQQIIISRSSVISTLLQTYAQDSSVNFSQELQNIVETFEYRETMELMAIDSSRQGDDDLLRLPARRGSAHARF